MSAEDRQFIHEKSPYKRHPLAAIFPMMSPNEAKDLEDSMRDHGFREEETIVLFEGHVLDGSNRLRACLVTGTKPQYRNYAPDYDGASPLAFVRDKNYNRRHMAPGQRAAVAAEFLPYAQEEAKQRLAAHKKTTTEPAPVVAPPAANAPAEGAPSNVVVFVDEDPLGIGNQTGAPDSETGATSGLPLGTTTNPPPAADPQPPAADVPAPIDLVAKMFGTGTTSLKLANKLKQKAPDLHEAVLKGPDAPGGMTLHAASEEFKKREKEKNSGAVKEKQRTERRQAIADLVTKYGAEHRITTAAKEKKICKDHNDLLIFAGLVEAEGKKLFPLMFSQKWTVERTQKFLSGKPTKDSSAEDLANFAKAHLEAVEGQEAPTEYVVELFGLRFTIEVVEKA